MSLASRSLSLVVVESLTSVVVVLFAILGNTVLLVALCRKPRTKNSTLVMVGALALVDLLTVITTAPLFVLSLATGKLTSNNFGCVLTGFLAHSLPKASILVMTLTAINRYYCVLKPDEYKRLFNFHRTIYYNVSAWIFATSEVLAVVVLGQAKIFYIPPLATCIMTFPNRNLQIAYTLYSLFFYMVLCLIIICFCYNRVSRFIRQHNANIVSLTTQEINLTRALFVLIFSFVILWVPFYIIFILYRMILSESHFPREMGFASTLLNHLSSAINPWVYGVMSPLVRKKMKKVLFRPRQLLRVSPGPANTTTPPACANRNEPLEENDIDNKHMSPRISP